MALELGGTLPEYVKISKKKYELETQREPRVLCAGVPADLEEAFNA